MKCIHYDAEGDILSVTFAESEGQTHTGVELSENIVFYYNPETKEALGLVLVSYRTLLRVSGQTPILLEGLARAPLGVQQTIIPLLQGTPVSHFFQLVETKGQKRSKLTQVFTPSVLKLAA